MTAPLTTAPVYWWSVLLAAMPDEHADVFIAEGGVFRQSVYRRCGASFEDAIRRCVLLERLARADVTQH